MKFVTGFRAARLLWPTFSDELTEITGRGTSYRDLRSVARLEDRGCSGQRKGRSCDPDMTCMFYAGSERMDLIPMILWKIVEILGKLARMWSRLGRLGDAPERHPLSFRHFCLEKGQTLEKSMIDSFFQARAGFRNIMKVDWKSTLGSLLSILPCRVPMNLSFSLSHLRPLSFLN